MRKLTRIGIGASPRCDGQILIEQANAVAVFAVPALDTMAQMSF
tara:strand:+ start:346 stop:477 length:132 start_codon:yes stop_codon:yes gene_type:complete